MEQISSRGESQSIGQSRAGGLQEIGAPPENCLDRQIHSHVSDEFVDYAIDDGISDGETNLNFRNDELMRDKNTNEVRVEASRSKLSADKRQM